LVNPVTVIGLDDPVPVIPPGVDVAVYVTAAVPETPVKVTVALPIPAVAVPMVGAAGSVVAVVVTDEEPFEL
jgi:hypothetical protein